MRTNFGDALSEEVRPAVVPPPLCKTCRWCRPAWAFLILPPFWPLAILCRYFWESAKCRHPTSLEQPRYRNYVSGRQEKPRRMCCDWARLDDHERRGPQARFWQARGYPPWVWTIGSIGTGLVMTIAYIALVRWL